MVQRVLAAKDEWHARVSVVGAGFLHVIMPFFFIVPGIIALKMFPTLPHPDQAYLVLVREPIPTGLKGLLLAGMAALIITAIARGIERKRPDKVLCLPTLWPGHSTHHLFFPGTLSVSQMPYIQLVIELCRSIVNFGAKKVFLLNGHGGNDVPLRATLRELKSEFPKVRFVFASYWSLAAQSIKTVRESDVGGLGHACEMETSIMLHLHPARVKRRLAKRDGPKHKDPYRKSDMLFGRPVYFVNEFHEVSKTGTIGHPDLATAEKGEKFLDGIVKDVTAFVDEFVKW